MLGPFLWNILYDGVFRLKLPLECQLIAHADDLALLARGQKLK